MSIVDRVLFESDRGDTYDENNEQVDIFKVKDDEDKNPHKDATNFDKYLDKKAPEKVYKN
ncbi:hypothetical protein A0J61_07281 [Choanephora cucurbitarum]|uniref:Uncharacterized protein n=1 Tax=Choanephora cucurbitarum TaxID=101091 RepID=A0A1C7N6B4_9FUNG|nr:hypothetical protein A0J61_07281 [Choanephora cucurbitarum]